MNRRGVILAAAVWLGAAGWLAAAEMVRGFDTIKTATDKLPLRGIITVMTPLEVELRIGAGSKKVPVNEIVYVAYDGEPTGLKTGRTALMAGRYEEVLTSLEKVTADEQSRPEIKQEVEFYTAFCRAELALGGSGDVIAAGRLMAAFVNTQKGSYHWLQANEIVGDLLVANSQHASAEKYYAELGKAPWPDYQMRAGVAVGRARLAQKRIAEALDSFDAVLKIESTGELAQLQRLGAMVGKARCQVANKQYDEAIKTANEVIAKADPEQVELNARAYNVLGTALKEAGRVKEALLAFLHVDVLYFTAPEQHAEALANLAQLWEKARKPERADRARRTLEERYKNSPWAKQAAGGAG